MIQEVFVTSSWEHRKIFWECRGYIWDVLTSNISYVAFIGFIPGELGAL